MVDREFEKQIEKEAKIAGVTIEDTFSHERYLTEVLPNAEKRLSDRLESVKSEAERRKVGSIASGKVFGIHLKRADLEIAAVKSALGRYKDSLDVQGYSDRMNLTYSEIEDLAKPFLKD